MTQPESDQQDSSLPAFIQRREAGVFFDAEKLKLGESFIDFVNRLFAGGARFAGLDYAQFIHALYDVDAIDGQVRIAQDIVRFIPERQALYKGVKIVDHGHGQRAQFVFEPVVMETVVDEPVYGPPGEDGETPIVEYVQRKHTVATQLDFDEFVADMWQKGVRFGIDVDVVNEAISKAEVQRLDVARELAPTAGHDAEVVEACEALYRDNSPKLLPDGRANLRRFANRFPHVTKGMRLLKKIRRVMGDPGRKVDGTIVEPTPPKDVDLFALAGPGTYVERASEGEYIVAVQDGFLTLDLAANLISITETIENHEGVSLRTTGDLSLAVDEFVEHGEVQEGRLVEGRHMTFKSAVYGDIRSLDGHIHIETTLSGGSARSVGGDVLVDGRATNAVLEAMGGRLVVKFAEGCTIIGKSVEIERAVGCQIVAEALNIGLAEGCGILAKNIRVASSSARKDKETIITVIVPDIGLYDRQIAAVEKAASEVAAEIEVLVQQMVAEKSEPGLAKYMAINTQVRQGGITLSDAQKAQLQKMAAPFAPAIKKLQAMEATRLELIKKRQGFDAEVQRLQAARADCGAGTQSEIGEVLGGTVVQKLASSEGILPLRALSATELKVRAHSLTAAQDRLFAGDHGNFSWQFAPPGQPD